LRLPHSVDNWLTDGGEVVSLKYQQASLYPPERFLVLISVRGSVDPRAIVRLVGLGQLKKIHLTRTRTRDLLACSVMYSLK
jgi:hypothetical protein